MQKYYVELHVNKIENMGKFGRNNKMFKLVQGKNNKHE